MRISRALALAGIASRRKAEEHVVNGAVTVNGEVVRDLGRQVDPENDVLCFRGKPLEFQAPIYYIMNKPKGYVTTASDPNAEKTVYDLLPRMLVASSRQPGHKKKRVFPVGRLDRDTLGLLLFTNDGELANRLTHPRYGVGKWYEVRLNRALEHADEKKILAGVRLYDGIARVEKVRTVSRRVIHLFLREGRKREVRRIFEKLEYKVVYLIRIAFGPLVLQGLLPGQGRYLKKKEVEALKAAAVNNKDA